MSTYVLRTNEVLKVGEYLVSENQAFFAVLQSDGNFCVYAGPGPGDNRGFVWNSGPAKKPAQSYYGIMQGDGNFCVYSGTGRDDRHDFVWGTGPGAGAGEYFLALMNTGELLVYAGPFPPIKQSPKIIWQNNVARNAPLNAAKVEEIIQRYGPVLHFHPEERYFLTTVEKYLAQSTLVDNKTGSRIPSPKVSDLPTGERDGDRFWLDVPESAKGGDLGSAKVYVHVKHDISKDYTDFQFWLFSAYNGPGTAFLKSWAVGIEVSRGNANLAPLGEHFSDWEYVSLRYSHTIDKPVSVFFSQHGGGVRIPYLDLERVKDQFLVYVSKNGHANYPKIGDNFSEYRYYGSKDIGTYIEFMLRNDTGEGKKFDCAKNYELVAADCIERTPAPAKWLDYAYRWGPISATTTITVQAVEELLSAALGFLRILVPVTLFMAPLATLIASIFVKDDKNGVVGPKQHAGSWNGEE